MDSRSSCSASYNKGTEFVQAKLYKISYLNQLETKNVHEYHIKLLKVLLKS